MYTEEQAKELLKQLRRDLSKLNKETGAPRSKAKVKGMILALEIVLGEKHKRC